MTAPLWLALYLPLLALDVFGAAGGDEGDQDGVQGGKTPAQADLPAVVVAQHRVVIGNDAAGRQGVEAGMGMAVALGLAHGMTIYERKPALEAQALQDLACWAGCFTPQVWLAEPDCLLLEVGGCLRLFGGLPALQARVESECRALGYTVCSALAPTPRAAQWLAQVRPGHVLTADEDWRAVLADFPVTVLSRDAALLARINTWGVRTLGALLRLPTASLRLRLGEGPMLALAQGMGDAPDIRRAFEFPRQFRHDLELPAPVEHAPALLFAARRSIAALCGWLTKQTLAIIQCELEFSHRGCPPSRLELRFAEALRDPARIERVCRERLERHALVAPVERLCLRAQETVAMPGASGELFVDASLRTGAGEVIERLRSRMGEGSVYGLALVADHRPECAVRRAAQGAADVAATTALRPFWLLPQARALREVRGQPCLDAPLRLLRGPERIESGWWDQGEAGAVGAVRRDYFIARSVQGGACLWIYRDQQGWWLHGIF